MNRLAAAQLAAMGEGCPGSLSYLSNASALLMEVLDDINWVGFYIRRGEELILGPFQGKAACVRIPMGRGVCGTAAAEDRVVAVEDVHMFPGHIACDSASASEIVAPLHDLSGRVVGVLDIDSPVRGRFNASHAPAAALAAGEIEKILSVLGDLARLAGEE
ncbi:MAG: GAF domain-containing protein [Clostridia bacterium]|nr:GAF domain-containing protein [Clostridia bacterium]